MQDFEILLNDRGIPRLLFSQRAGKSYCIVSQLGDWLVGYEIIKHELMKDDDVIPFQLILIDKPSDMIFVSLARVVGGITKWNFIMEKIPEPKFSIAMLENKNILKVTDHHDALVFVEICDKSRWYIVTSHDLKDIGCGGKVSKAFGTGEAKIFFFDPHNEGKSHALRNTTKLLIIDKGKLLESKDSPAKAR